MEYTYAGGVEVGILKYLLGTVVVELTSADISATLHSMNNAGIPIASIDMHGDLTAVFTISREHLSAMKSISERKGDTLRVLHYDGGLLYFRFLWKRPVLFCMLAVFAAVLLVVPGRVLFISVEGNQLVPCEKILEAAESAGVYFGAIRKDVRSEQVKNSLLSYLPQLQWVGINTSGCTAVISVRERAILPQGVDNVHPVSNIVASRDGVVVSCTATKGTSLCTEGQAVKKGEALISGYVDSGRIVTAQQAEGEIFARTQHELLVKTPANAQSHGKFLNRKTKFSLIIRKKRINFTKGSGIYDGSCVKMYSEYYLTLPGGFFLPVVLVKETICEYQTLMQQRSADLVAQQLTDYAKEYLAEQTISLTIHDTREELIEGDTLYSLRGEYGCIEMIGREQSEEIGDFHGKTN